MERNTERRHRIRRQDPSYKELIKSALSCCCGFLCFLFGFIGISILVINQILPHMKLLVGECITTDDQITHVIRTGMSETIYRIYIPRFKNSDSSTIEAGDISGVSEMLPYFQQMNISVLWISSLQKMRDGNDEELTSFDDVDLILANKDPETDQLKEFIDKANAMGIKVIMDITINHSSDIHKWFTESKKNSSTYRDFYNWHPGRNISGQRQPPNNWTSVTGESAWTWVDSRQAYYFHRFNSRKPDLNWRNENVRQEMKKMIDHWLTRGFFGFYIRDFPYLIDSDWENADQSLVIDIPENMDILNLLQTQVQSWKNQHNVSDDRLLLFSSMEKTRKAELIPGVLLGLVDDALYTMKMPFTASELNTTVRGTIDRSNEKNAFPVWILGNEMNSRIATKFGPKAAAHLQYLQLLLPGSSVIYYGEEIGMTDLTDDDMKCTVNEMDRYRSSMQWNDQKFAGFSTKQNVCTPLNPNYKETNVDSQMNNSSSPWHTIQTLIHVKRSLETFLNGSIAFPAGLNDDHVFTFTRYDVDKSIRILVALNTGTISRSFALVCPSNSGDFQKISPQQWQVQIKLRGDDRSSVKNETSLSGYELDPSDVMVLIKGKEWIL